MAATGHGLLASQSHSFMRKRAPSSQAMDTVINDTGAQWHLCGNKEHMTQQ